MRPNAWLLRKTEGSRLRLPALRSWQAWSAQRVTGPALTRQGRVPADPTLEARQSGRSPTVLLLETPVLKPADGRGYSDTRAVVRWHCLSSQPTKILSSRARSDGPASRP